MKRYGVTRFVNLSGGHGDRLIASLEGAAPYEPQITVCASQMECSRDP